MQAELDNDDAWLGSLGVRLRGYKEEGPGLPGASPEKYRDKALRLEVEDKVSLFPQIAMT